MKELASKYVDRAAMRREGGETAPTEDETPAAGLFIKYKVGEREGFLLFFLFFLSSFLEKLNFLWYFSSK